MPMTQGERVRVENKLDELHDKQDDARTRRDAWEERDRRWKFRMGILAIIVLCLCCLSLGASAWSVTMQLYRIQKLAETGKLPP